MPTLNTITAWTLAGVFKDATLDHTTPSERLGKRVSQTWGSGTGDNQANEFWSDRRSLAATSENIDLYGGLTDGFGNTINFATLREILILNRSAVSGEDLTISGNFITTAVLGGTTPTLTVPAGGRFNLSKPVDGFTVTNSSADIITIDAGAATISFDLFLIGTV